MVTKDVGAPGPEVKLSGAEWVDRSGRAVKLNLTAVAGDGMGNTVKFVVDVQVDDLRTPIKIVPPPAAGVTQLSAHPDLASALPIHPGEQVPVTCHP